MLFSCACDPAPAARAPAPRVFWFEFFDADAPDDLSVDPSMAIAEDGSVVIDSTRASNRSDDLTFGRIIQRTADEQGTRWRVRLESAVSKVANPHAHWRDTYAELDTEFDLILQGDGTLLGRPIKGELQDMPVKLEGKELRMVRWRLYEVNRQLSRLAFKWTFRYHVRDAVRDAE